MLTQSELANKIRSGYEKHNLNVTNQAYYHKGAACPIFAAFADDFADINDAIEANARFFYLNDAEYSFLTGMAKSIGIDLDLATTISDLFNYNANSDLDDVLHELDNGTFEVNND